MHFNQRFVSNPCPLKGFPQGQEFKNWTNKYKGNKHQRQAGGQAEGDPCPGHSVQTPRQPGSGPLSAPAAREAVLSDLRAEGRLHHHTLTPVPGPSCLAPLLPTPATLLCDLRQGLPSLVFFLQCAVRGGFQAP